MHTLLLWHLHGSNGSVANEISEYKGVLIGLREHVKEQESVLRERKISDGTGQYSVERVVLHCVVPLTTKAMLG